MTGPVLVLDLGIVLGALVDIVDHERNRRAGGRLLAGRFIQKHAGKDFDRVRFLPLGGEARLAGAAAVQIGLNVMLAQSDAWRATVDDAADRRPMAFAEGGHPEGMSERIEGHG